MKGFHFRLDSLLHLRSFETERARIELSQRRQQAAAAAAAVRRTLGAIAEASSQLELQLSSGVAAAQLQLAQSGLYHLHDTAQRQTRSASKARARIAPARDAVQRAWSKQRALEILRERALSAYRKEQERREQKEFDEIAVERALLRRRAREGRRDAA